jgi:o-succinylbenzoate synthase
LRYEFIPYAIAFREPVATGAGTWSERRGAWLRLEGGDGRVGWGEAAPLDPMELAALMERIDPSAPAARIDTAEALAEAAGRGPCGRAAFELAALDLEAQRIGRPLAFLLADSPRPRVAVNALLFSQGAAQLAAEARRAVAEGYGTLKIKVGSSEPDEDIGRVRAVREAVGAGVAMRLDANCAWDEATALRVLRAVADCDIEFIEDAVAGDLHAVRRGVDIPVAADVRTLAEGEELVGRRGADFLVLKPMALGRLRSVRELALSAIESGIGVVITSVFDTAVGVAGALHLAAGLPGTEHAHGLATVGLLEEAPVEGLEPPHRGEMVLPKGPGLGVRLREHQP